MYHRLHHRHEGLLGGNITGVSQSAARDSSGVSQVRADMIFPRTSLLAFDRKDLLIHRHTLRRNPTSKINSAHLSPCRLHVDLAPWYFVSPLVLGGKWSSPNQSARSPSRASRASRASSSLRMGQRVAMRRPQPGARARRRERSARARYSAGLPGTEAGRWPGLVTLGGFVGEMAETRRG